MQKRSGTAQNTGSLRKMHGWRSWLGATGLSLEQICMRNYTESLTYHSNRKYPQGWEPMRGGRMRRFAITTGFGLFLTFILAGCGGGSSSSSSSSNQKVASVTLSPSTVSVNAGEIVQLTAAALNAAGNAVSTTITFNSSNSNIASVSTAGEVCGGAWAAKFMVCNGLTGTTFASGKAT